MRLALRNRAFMFFSLVMPLAFLFVYATLFGRSDPRMVGYLLPSVLALTVMGSFWGLSIQLVMFREQGILRRFRLAPLGPFGMLVSSLISNYILTLPTVIVELLLARWVWRVPSFGNLWGLFILLSLGTLTFAAFGLIVASVTSSIQETQMINNAVWFLFLFFSGATFPIVFFPGWVQRVSVFLPATHLVIGLQYVFLGGVSILKVGPEVFALLVGLSMALFLSMKLFRWEPEEKIERRAKLAALAVVIPFLLVGVWENAQDARRSELRAIYNSATQQRLGPAAPAAANPSSQNPAAKPPDPPQ
jgi:ABC-2 type transport system permease protein